MKITQKLKELLLKAGLLEAEVSVYLELLKSPSQSKWDLVGRTGLNRNKVYRAFEKLDALKLIEESKKGVKASSLKTLVADLKNSQRKLGKIAYQIKEIAPFLRLPRESIDSFDTCYTHDQMMDAYTMMSELKYDTCLDFGDFENFVPIVGSMDPITKFRENRYKNMAKSKVICTTSGPYTKYMSRKDDLKRFNSNLDVIKDVDFKGKWIIFSDTNDHVMFNDFSDIEHPSSVIIKSKTVADAQRMQFDYFAKQLGV